MEVPRDFASEEFAIEGKLVTFEELKRGHINRTYVGTWKCDTGPRRFVHQLVNHNIFKNVSGLMGNMKLITDRIRWCIDSGEAAEGDITLTIVPTKTGESFLVTAAGEYWRTFDFIENTTSFEVCPGSTAAFESAAILGRFQRYIADIPVSALCDTIPFFLDGERRFVALESALALDPVGRRRSSAEVVKFALSRRELGGSLIDAMQRGEIACRPTHNDMKLNNVLFRETGMRAVCLVDLDTCMPGTPLFDFGDLVRNTAVPCAEDERDLSKVHLDMILYEEICRGYLSEFGSLLSAPEVQMLSVAPRVLALVLGVRFLTDHILGDTYFRIQRPNHNLERAMTQFEIVCAMDRVEEKMIQVVEEVTAGL